MLALPCKPSDIKNKIFAKSWAVGPTRQRFNTIPLYSSLSQTPKT